MNLSLKSSKTTRQFSVKHSSIYYTITFIFILSLVSISLAFFWLIDYDRQNYERELNTKYSLITRANLYYANDLIPKTEYEKQVANFDMPEILDAITKNDIIKNAQILEEIEGDIGASVILNYKNQNFLKLTHDDKVTLLKDNEFQPYRYIIIKIIFGIVFSIVLITYIFTIRKLRPLRALKKQIDKFASGEMNIVNVSDANDEIGEISQAFYDAALKIKKLNDSRQLFLRNIMHELKTPITKGRISVEMTPKSKNKTRLIGVFEKLEDLINELANIERITSGYGLYDTNRHFLSEILDQAIKISMVERECVAVNIDKNLVLNVDFKLFSTAIKNMIDNAIKYSVDKKVEIFMRENALCFANKGEKLEKELDFYLEPFSKGSNAKNSFGLGFYIVENVLKAHKLELKYKFEDDKNIFSFVGLKNIICNENLG